jgi:hypothetical protein
VVSIVSVLAEVETETSPVVAWALYEKAVRAVEMPGMGHSR